MQSSNSPTNPWLRALLLTALALAVLIGVYATTLGSMAAIWQRSDTFAHGFFVAPISLWLIWRERASLKLLKPQPCLPAVLLLFVSGLAWLVAKTAGVVVVEQLAWVSMIWWIVWAVLGTQLVRRLLFPLGFLLFMVPFGDFLMDPLMNQTADFVVAALQFTGIPVFREGNFFTIPSGNWSVVEACSGLRYLIASIMLGSLFAYLTYRSTWRRLVFFVASIVVPVLANWVRAYLIVMIAHLSSNKLATGIDHIIYGWLFFGIVMVLLFWIGTWWREDLTPYDEIASAASESVVATSSSGSASAQGFFIACASAVLILCIWRPALYAIEHVGSDAVPVLGALPVDLDTRWQAQPQNFSAWIPHYLHPRSVLQQTFMQGTAADATHSVEPVSVFIGYYKRQRQNGDLVTYDNQVVMVGDKQWGSINPKRRAVDTGQTHFKVVEAQVRGNYERMLAWKWYWIGGRWTDNDYLAKAYIALNMLTGRGDDSAVIIVYTPVDAYASEQAAQRLEAFVAVALPSIEQSLQAAYNPATQTVQP